MTDSPTEPQASAALTRKAILITAPEEQLTPEQLGHRRWHQDSERLAAELMPRGSSFPGVRLVEIRCSKGHLVGVVVPTDEGPISLIKVSDLLPAELRGDKAWVATLEWGPDWTVLPDGGLGLGCSG